MSRPAAAVTSEWLSLRESADRAARSRDLVARLLAWLPPGDVLIHDLGSGTGSMTRWLAPQLARAQHWVLHDLDDTLLAQAVAAAASHPYEGVEITVSTRHRDVTTIDGADLTGATFVTTSALLDLLTADEVTRIATACVRSASPALFTLSVTGRVQVEPRHPLDAAIEAAFNAHQQRRADGRLLLGPEAAAHAWTAFSRLGAEVFVANTPWQLSAADVALVEEWLAGWVAAACEQEPQLTGPAAEYLRQRLAEASAGKLRVTVGHADLLAIPGAARVEPHTHEARETVGEG